MGMSKLLHVVLEPSRDLFQIVMGMIIGASMYHYLGIGPIETTVGACIAFVLLGVMRLIEEMFERREVDNQK